MSKGRGRRQCVGVLAVVGILGSLWFPLTLSGAGTGDPQVPVTIATDRPEAIYHVGETATFMVEVQPVSNAVQEGFSYTLSLDGAGDLGKGVLTLEDGRATVSGALDKPGILRCTVSREEDSKKRIVSRAAAAFDPEKIQPTATEPADFDAFWTEQEGGLAGVPLDARLVPMPQTNDTIEVFKISLANINDTRVYGFVAKPKAQGPFPAILNLPGAGVSSRNITVVTNYAASGFLAMEISAHDVENGLPPEQYKQLKKGKLRAYSWQGREHRDSCYFRRVFLGCVRAVDYLTSRPDWDGTHMIVKGSSQGGGLTLAATGLDPRVTAAAANVPGLCDHTGPLHGRPYGFPRFIHPGRAGTKYKPDPKIVAASAYYDVVNFARRIKVPVFVGVGLIDSTCPPTTIFSAYNTLSCPKQIDIAPLMGHGFSKSFKAAEKRWLLGQGGLQR